MSNAVEAPPVAAAETVTSVQTTAAPVVTTPHVTAAVEDKEPSWLKGRLDRERESATKAILRELGVENPSDAKAAIAAYRQAQDAQKSEATRAAEKIIALESRAKRADEVETILAARAAAEFAALPAERQAAIVALAGDDPAARIKAIDALRPTWAAPLPAPATKPPLAAPASTTAAPPAPPPEALSSENVLATYEALNAKNPAAAAAYRLANWSAYIAAKQARG